MSDWIEWSGGKCPVAPSTPVMVCLSSGDFWRTDHPELLNWGKFNHPGSIAAYRVLPPAVAPAPDVTKALAEALEAAREYVECCTTEDEGQDLASGVLVKVDAALALYREGRS